MFRTDAEGRLWFRGVMPVAYPIPTDGPVGDMLRATKRHPWRPAHVHFMIQAPGYETLITHVFRDGDRYLDSDAVFGVRSSLIGDFVSHPAGDRAGRQRAGDALPHAELRLRAGAGGRALKGCFRPSPL